MENKRCKYYINKGCSCNNDEDGLGDCAYEDGIKRDNACITCDYFEAIEVERIDNVNHPAHYTRGKIEVIDFIEDQKLNYNRGNVVKYTCRAGFKDPTKEIEDLEKTAFYLDREIKRLKAEQK